MKASSDGINIIKDVKLRAYEFQVEQREQQKKFVFGSIKVRTAETLLKIITNYVIPVLS